MSFEITWHDNFYGISWAYEKDRLVVSTVFEDKPEAKSRLVSFRALHSGG
mgnify:CR=1 FL=1